MALVNFKFRAILHPLSSILALLLLYIPGCIAAGVAAHKLIGPPPVPAQYVPAKTPLLVMVENYRTPSTAYTDDEMLSRYIEGYLRGHQVAPLVESSKLRELRQERGSSFHNLSVASIGHELGAAQILYVDVVHSEVEMLMAGESLRGSVGVRIKMIDVESGETLWPIDIAEGYALDQSVQYGKTKITSEMDLKQGIYAQLGEKIAKLFYKWKPDFDEPEGFIAE